MESVFRVIYRALDYTSSVQFYRDVMEFPVLQEWDRGPAQKGTVFRVFAGEIEVLCLPPGQEYFQPQGFEIAIEVNDVEETYQFVTGKGIALHGDIANKPWGHRAFSVKDPDGIKLIFFTVI